MAESRGARPFTLRWVALDKHVLMVAVKSDSVDYDTYVGAVKGENYDEEALEVVVNGSVVWGNVSEVYFEPRRGRVKTLFHKEPYHDARFGESVMSGRKAPPGILDLLPIDKHVLVVAASRPGHTWRAYIGAVKGEDYYEEAPAVVANGSEIPFEMALECFEDLAKGSRVVGNEWQAVPPTEREIEHMREQGWKVSRGEDNEWQFLPPTDEEIEYMRSHGGKLPKGEGNASESK